MPKYRKFNQEYRDSSRIRQVAGRNDHRISADWPPQSAHPTPLGETIAAATVYE